jgi:hypothetical protein
VQQVPRRRDEDVVVVEDLSLHAVQVGQPRVATATAAARLVVVRHRWGSRVRGRRRWWTGEEEEERESELGDGEAGVFGKPRECALKRRHNAKAWRRRVGVRMAVGLCGTS